MPNWSSSKVTIQGNVSELESILEQCVSEEKPFSFEKFIPTPEGLDGEGSFNDLIASMQADPETFEFKDWYSWRIAFWGTKWDLDENTIVDVSKLGDGVLQIEYYSAWSPALNFWKNFSKLYPSVTIVDRYFELGAGFIGEAVIHNGMMNDECQNVTDDIMARAGAVFDEDGEVDWEACEVDMFSVFPLNAKE